MAAKEKKVGAMAEIETYESLDDFSREVLGLSEHEIWLSDARCRMIKHIIDSRKKQGLSQKDLAEMLGTTQSVVSRIENGLGKGITLDYLIRVVSVLGMTPRLTVRKQAA